MLHKPSLQPECEVPEPDTKIVPVMDKLLPISTKDVYLFHEGRNFRSYMMLGAHIGSLPDGTAGTRFTVWAPHARQVAVIGSFNHWDVAAHPLQKIENSGVWMLFIPGVEAGALYKYSITSPNGKQHSKADPYAFAAEVRPGSASIVQPLKGYKWQDYGWMFRRKAEPSGPIAIYEVHAGSWNVPDPLQLPSYRDLADGLISYVLDLGFTHIELMPLTEHPLDASWGYQTTGYYAPTSRYGTPEDLKYFIDSCHRNGIGVIMDWVPGHFCKDEHGLRAFDGTPLFEGVDPKRAENYGWGTLNFDFSSLEVWSFLISNALYWLEQFHIDGLRVDAVANMLYLDYGKSQGEWQPNVYGGNENLDAVQFLRKLNEVIHEYYPNSLIFAEESTAWPAVTRPVYLGGLGFDYKWNMGWMNDMLKYMSMDPIYRKWHHRLLTFSLTYAFAEQYVLPLSHDEVVHGKKSLLDKMPGDYWQKFANIRAFYAYFIAHPGKKLLFMGGEFGQFAEWQEWKSLDWQLLNYEMHRKLQVFTQELLHIYRHEPAFWQLDRSWHGFEWIDCSDAEQSVVAFLRLTAEGKFIIVVCNFTPVGRFRYRIGVPSPGQYVEVLNSDCVSYGGSGQGNGKLEAERREWHGREYSLAITLPPLATIFIKLANQSVGDEDKGEGR